MANKKTQDTPQPDFFLNTKSLEIKEHDGGPTVIATASSNAIDLEGDRFTKSALEQMRDGFEGKMIFLNHSYNVPEDVFGTVEATKLIKRGGRLDLDMEISVQTDNERAQKTFDMIQGGTTMGVSVGVIVTEANKSDDEDENGRKVVDIDGVLPLEASIVGIPANQTAWTHDAIKSLVARGEIEFDDDEIEARPWLKAVVAGLEQKDEDMKEDTKSEDEDEEVEKRDHAAEDEEGEEDDDDKKDKSDSEDTTDEEDSEEGSSESADDDEETKATTDDESEADEEKDESKSEEEDVDSKDLEGQVEASGAIDEFVDKMYDSFFIVLRSTVNLLLSDEVGGDERRAEGVDMIAELGDFLSKIWDEANDAVDNADKAQGSVDIASRIHDRVADEVSCRDGEVDGIIEQIDGIAEAANDVVIERDALAGEIERLTQALGLADEALETFMELPLGTVTDKAPAEVVKSLAEQFPMLDDRVVARMVTAAEQRVSAESS